MSLKAFHLVFVICMTFLTFGTGAWLLHRHNAEPDNRLFLPLAIASLVAGVAVLIYGKYFLKKLKKYSYL